MPGVVYNQLFDVAADQHGYVTVDDARALGIDPRRLVVMAQRGTVDRVASGLYRVGAFPVSAHDLYMEAVLWPRGVRGVLGHETALDLHDLCDVDPLKVHVTVPRAHRTRRAVPDFMVIHRRDLDPDVIGVRDGIPVVSAAQAILDGIEQRLGSDLIDQAFRTARDRGMLTEQDVAVIARLGAGRR